MTKILPLRMKTHWCRSYVQLTLTLNKFILPWSQLSNLYPSMCKFMAIWPRFRTARDLSEVSTIYSRTSLKILLLRYQCQAMSTTAVEANYVDVVAV